LIKNSPGRLWRAGAKPIANTTAFADVRGRAAADDRGDRIERQGA